MRSHHDDRLWLGCVSTATKDSDVQGRDSAVGSPRRTIFVAWTFRGGRCGLDTTDDCGLESPRGPDVGPRLGRPGPRFGRGQPRLHNPDKPFWPDPRDHTGRSQPRPIDSLRVLLVGLTGTAPCACTAAELNARSCVGRPDPAKRHSGQRVVGMYPNSHECAWQMGGGGPHSRQMSGQWRHLWIATAMGGAAA